jgi:cell division protein FtsW
MAVDAKVRQENIAPARKKVNLLTGGSPDYWYMATLAFLLLLGTVIIYSASFVNATLTDDEGNSAAILYRHLVFLGVGLVAMLVMMSIDYHRWQRLSGWFLLAIIIALVAVVVLPAPIAPRIGGAKRWIVFSKDSIQFQPSEFAKIALILYGSYWLISKGDKVRNFMYGLLPYAVTFGFVFGLVVIEPDFGTSLVIGMIGLGMIFIAGANIIHIVGGLAIATVAGWLIIHAESYRVDRLVAYADPFADPTGVGYHTVQALTGLGSGGWLGVGLGASRGKFLWLPTVYTDSIFAVLGEELGLVGAGLVVILFLTLAWRGFFIAQHAPDRYGRLVAAGMTIYIVFQAFLNIAVVSNLVPFTGIPLPFISYGGSSLVITLAGIGVLLNISRQMVDNPRIIELAEQRDNERTQREFARAERMAERERRMAQAKLKESQRAIEDKEELSKAEVRWRETVARQKADDEFRSLLQKEYERQKQKNAPPLEDIPAPATKSFLEFSSGKVDTSNLDELEQPAKPKLRRPSKNWAKTYENKRK